MPRSDTDLQTFSLWCIWSCCHIWSCCDHNFGFLSFSHIHLCGIPWPLTLKFSEKINTAQVSLFDWKCSNLVYFIGAVATNCILTHIWSCTDLDLRSLDLKFSEMLNIAAIRLFNWQKFLFGISEWSCGSKLVFLPIFVHVVTLIFDPQIFRNTKHCPNKIYLIEKSPYLVYWKEVMALKLHFCPYLVQRWLWPLDLKFSEKNVVNTSPIILLVAKGAT